MVPRKAGASLTQHYKLVGKKPVPCSVTEWSKMFADPEGRKIAYDKVGDSLVSTVFLGIPHGHADKDRPLLFETMVFGGTLAGEMYRSTTYDAALHNHDAMVTTVKLVEASALAQQRAQAMNEAAQDYEEICEADRLLQSHKG